MGEKTIDINELYEFEGNPYLVKNDEDMEELMESIKENGVLEPLLVREKDEGGYEIISGHRRREACMKLGIEKLPCLVKDMTRDEAVIALVDSNLKRTNILPSERAFAYKMKLEAQRHQGKTCGTEFHKSRDEVAEGTMSGRQVSNYVRLTNLIEPLLNLVDENKIALKPAVALSYLTFDEQFALSESIDINESTPSYSQAIKMKTLSQKGALNADIIENIMEETKANQEDKLQFKINDISKYFPSSYTPKRMYETIEKLLENFMKRWKERDNER